jgi:hypothetical protein
LKKSSRTWSKHTGKVLAKEAYPRRGVSISLYSRSILATASRLEAADAQDTSTTFPDEEFQYDLHTVVSVIV